MAILKCKMCGAPLHCSGSATVVECEYCESRQTISLLDDEKILELYDRANQYRSLNEFDKASVIYDNILTEKPSEAEAHWGICLCRYGIEYVQDPRTGKRVPTCHRTQFKSILDDPDYLAAIKHADRSAKEVYSAEAEYIDTVQKGILSISSKEDPFDIFICYKESDQYGGRTLDSVLAQDIYNKLTDEGYRVFFARITLEDKLGSAYEPYIFAALSSAKIMLVVGTKPEHLDAVWVKNEWSRYLSLMGQGQEKTIIPCYRDMSPYALPKEFVALQSQDMGKIGAMQDLVRGIEKILPLEKESSTETVVIQQGPATATTQSLLKRMFIYLEDSDWENANSYSERVLDIDPENSMAYLGKLLIDLRVCTEDQLKNCAQPFDHLSSYQKAYRYGNAALKRRLENALTYIKERNRIAEQERIYSSACERLRRARNAPLSQKNAPIHQNCSSAYDQFKRIANYKDSTVLMDECRELMYAHAATVQNGAVSDEDFQTAADLFQGIPGYQTYKDASARASECSNRAAVLRQERLYQSGRQAEQKGDITSLRDAIRYYAGIGSYKDAPQRLQTCQNKLSKLEADQKRKQQIEQKKTAKQEKKNRKKQKRSCGGCLWKLIKFYFIFGIIMAVIAGVVSLFTNDKNDASGTLETLTIAADQTECNIGDTVLLNILPFPENPEYVPGGKDSTEYFSEGNIHIYISENGAVEEIGTGTSVVYTFESSGEYVFFAKYCPHYGWNCDPTYDIVSEDITINVKGNPISSIEELEQLRDSEGDFQLTCDLDFEGVEWTPIENFTGKFSGGGYTIYNLTIDSNAENVGFFGTLDGDARNITFKNATVNADGRPTSVGILAGTVKGSINNVRIDSSSTVTAPKGTNVGAIAGLVTELPKSTQYKDLENDATVTGLNRVGGLFGAIEWTTVETSCVVAVQNCSNRGEVSGKESVGGIIGHLLLHYDSFFTSDDGYRVYMEELNNLGSITGDTQVGGIIGYGKTNSHESYLKNATNSAAVSAKAIAGGIAGKLESITVDGCTNEGALSVTGSVTLEDETCAYIGGIVGWGNVVTNCRNTVTIEYTGNGNYVGGIAGYVCDLPENAVMENNHNHAPIKGANYVGGLFGSIYSQTDSHHTLTMSNSSNDSEISGKDSVGGLIGELYLDNTWTSAFNDNNSYTAQLSELTNTGAVNGNLYVGGIIGDGVTDSRTSYLKDSQSSGSIVGKAYVGCIAGNLDLIALDNCSNEGSSLTATGYTTGYNNDSIKYACVGGYVGWGYIVNNCTNTVAIDYKGGGKYVGGIAGCLSGFTLEETTMENLQNKADITGASYTGGLIGEIKITQNVTELKFTFLDFSNEGNVSGTDYVGGLIGQLYLDDDNQYSDNIYEAKMDTLSNTGKITGKNYVGGILGYGKTTSTKSIMTDITADGAVSGKSNYNKVNGKVENITVE